MYTPPESPRILSCMPACDQFPIQHSPTCTSIPYRGSFQGLYKEICATKLLLPQKLTEKRRDQSLTLIILPHTCI